MYGGTSMAITCAAETQGGASRAGTRGGPAQRQLARAWAARRQPPAPDAEPYRGRVSPELLAERHRQPRPSGCMPPSLATVSEFTLPSPSQRLRRIGRAPGWPRTRRSARWQKPGGSTEGNTSLDNCAERSRGRWGARVHPLTAEARAERAQMTSFAFMFAGRYRAGLEHVERALVVVPAPGDLGRRVADRRGHVLGEHARPAVHRGAAAFIRRARRSAPSPMGSPDTGKFCTARLVWAPHSASAGTSRCPSQSC